MNGLVQLQDKIVARFALTIYPYSLGAISSTSRGMATTLGTMLQKTFGRN